MLKDEDICVHCGLCAERCPLSAAWDMQKSDVLCPTLKRQMHEANSRRKRFRLKLANVNGKRLGFRERAPDAGDLSDGDSRPGKNLFPPTYRGSHVYEVRVSKGRPAPPGR